VEAPATYRTSNNTKRNISINTAIFSHSRTIYNTLHPPRTKPHIISKMDALVAQHSRPAHAAEGYTEDELQHQMSADLAQPLSLQFALPPTASPSQWLRAMTDDHSNPQCPIKIAHGTTTLAFRHKGGIVVATDSRATAGDWIASQTVKKVIEINSCLLGTMAGGAAVSL
jgi:20S proteasome subunit beta 5